LIKRLKITGIPDGGVDRIGIWLNDRSFYLSIKEENSILFNLICSTVQEYILGPIRYAIYVSPLFNQFNLNTFAENNFVIRWNRHMPQFITDLEKNLGSITKWLKGSGLKVNKSMTELRCVYSTGFTNH
jgi:hypothetical protein